MIWKHMAMLVGLMGSVVNHRAIHMLRVSRRIKKQLIRHRHRRCMAPLILCRSVMWLLAMPVGKRMVERAFSIEAAETMGALVIRAVAGIPVSPGTGAVSAGMSGRYPTML